MSAPDTFIAPPALGVLRRLGWVLIVALLMLGSVAAWRWRVVFDPAAATALLANHPAAPLMFLGLHIAASLLFVPRTLLALAAGLAFGMWWGAIWAALGSVLGAVSGFLLARYLRPGLVAGSFGSVGPSRFGAILARVEHGGWRMVATLRLVPVIPHSLSNYALGLTRLRLLPYAFGSLLGQLPLTIAYVDLGAAGGRAIGGADWIMPSVIGLTALALSALVPVLARRSGWGRERVSGSAG